MDRWDKTVLSSLLPPRYRLVEEIGHGGMGLVLRVVDADLDRPLAVKVMLPGAASQEERFLAEARITGQLQHPGVPPVHEIGRLSDGRPFFSMKLIEGRTLADLLRQRTNAELVANLPGSEAEAWQPAPQDLPRFLKMFEQIAQTVAYAHSRGVIHRDLKPVNIMVGAFGEVQVMDWGLAKKVGRQSADSRGQKDESTRHEPEAGKPGGMAGAQRSDTSDQGFQDSGSATPAQTIDWSSDTPEARTQPGAVMGTSAYMPPEQARGQVDQVDARSDVFGLGAILCQILTGRPPYWAETGEQLLRLAGDADLGTAYSRLDACGADAELIALAKTYLAAEPAQRPADAGVVAQQITAYLQAVQERLRQAELERTAAQVKAGEERKKRRWQLALAAAVLILVLGGSAAGLWYEQEQARLTTEEALREQQLQIRRKQLHDNVTANLDEVERLQKQIHNKLANPVKVSELLSKIYSWKETLVKARAVWQHAKNLVAGSQDVSSEELANRLEEVQEQLKRDETDWQQAQKLDDIRLAAGTLVEGKWEPRTAGAKYKQFFGNLGPDRTDAKPSEVAAKIQQGKLRYVLVAALDHWAFLTEDEKLEAQLLETARLADPDPWRNQVRDPKKWFDRQLLEKLAREANLGGQSPQILELLASLLKSRKGDPATLLRSALVHYPQDFWLHFNLGSFSQDPGERIGCLQAAISLRPESSMAHSNLGVALAARNHLDGAIRHYHKAIELDPNFAFAHNNLGLALAAKKDLDGAIRHYHKAIQLDPNYAKAHNNLALALDDKKDLDGAIRHYHKAIQLDPNYAKAHYSLGIALKDKGDVDGAIRQFHKALEIDPKYAEAHNNLAGALLYKKDLDGAIQHLRKALDLDPNHPKVHFNLGGALIQQGQFAEALKAFKRGHELASKQPGWSYPSAQWVQNCAGLLQLDQQLPGLLKGDLEPSTPQQWLAYVQVCQMKRAHGSQAKLWQKAFAKHPVLVEKNRFQAACAAALAAGGRGQDAGQLSDSERTELGKQGLKWLQADVEAWTKQMEKKQPADLVALNNTLELWQKTPDLARVREVKSLAQLTEEERRAWHKLWMKVDHLRTQVQGMFRATRLTGELTAKEVQKIHEMKLTAGKRYVIDLESKAFDTFLRLEDAQGKKLAENDDIVEGVNLNSRIVFTPAKDGVYRLVATAFRGQGRGPYTLTVGEFIGENSAK